MLSISIGSEWVEFSRYKVKGETKSKDGPNCEIVTHFAFRIESEVLDKDPIGKNMLESFEMKSHTI